MRSHGCAFSSVLLPCLPLPLQEGAHCQVGSGGKGAGGCRSAGSGIRGPDGGESDLEAGPVTVYRATGKTSNTVSEETGLVLTFSDSMRAHEVGDCCVPAQRVLFYRAREEHLSLLFITRRANVCPEVSACWV